MLQKRILRILPWLLTVLAPLILFGPVFIMGRALFWGTPLLQFVPWRDFALETIRNGYLPLWNPLLGMGAPLIANYQSAIFYPPNLLLFVTGPAWGHGFLVYIHVVWAGIGMILLVRRLGWGELAQTIAALAFSLSGYLVARSSFLSINATVVWLPWIILATDRLAVDFSQKTILSARIKPILLLSVVLSLQWLAGHAQTAWYSLCLMLIWGIWRGLVCGGVRGGTRTILGLSLSASLAFCLSAIQLLPTLEYLYHSPRAMQVEREFALSYSFWPWRILGLIAPDLFGNPGRGEYWGYANYWEDAIYIGILPLILAIFAGIRSLKKSERPHLGILLLALAVISFLLALGKNTPLFLFLFDHIPTFDLFQAPTRWSIILVFCLALLGAKGADIWGREQLVSLFWVRLGTVGAAAGGLVALLGGRLLEGIKDSLSPAVASAALIITCVGAIAWRRRIKPCSNWEIAIGVFLAVDLLWAGWALVPSEPLELFRGNSQILTQVDPSHRIYMSAEQEERIKFEKTHRFDAFQHGLNWRDVRDAGLPNTAMLDGLSSVNNFDPILPERYVTWMKYLERQTSQRKEELLAFMDVGGMAIPNVETGVSYVQVQNPARARLIGKSIWVGDQQQALEIVFNGDFRLSDQVVLEGQGAGIDLGEAANAAIEFKETRNPNMVVINISSQTGGWLVLSDAYYPGWQAEVDQIKSTIYPANGLFRAVNIPAGEHEVIFRYRPLSFQVGIFLGLFAWLFIGIVWWRFVKNCGSSGR